VKKRLVALTLGEVLVLVGALAGYLVAIARGLRQVSETLAKVTMGVRAIEQQTQPIGPAVQAVTADLEAVATTLEVGRQAPAG
jgi:uncharacterized protein YoxC